MRRRSTTTATTSTSLPRAFGRRRQDTTLKPYSIPRGGNDNLGYGGGTANRANVIAPVTYPKTREQWFSTASFKIPTALQWGNMQRNMLRGPGRNNWNMSIFKQLMSYFGCQRFGAAAIQLKQAADLDPENIELRYKLAQSYLWSKQYQNAIEQFRLLLIRNPDSAPVHMLLGEVLDAANQEEQATAEFEAAVKVSPHQPIPRSMNRSASEKRALQKSMPGFVA
jgi:tetratricopeptide (TPR) repeat protein